ELQSDWAPAFAGVELGSRLRGNDGGANLLQRARILDRREVAGIAALADRLDRAAEQFPRARLRQQRHEANCRSTRYGAELALYGRHDLLLVRRGGFRRRRL